MNNDSLKLELVRIFNAPRAQVFNAWTEREHLERWMCRDDPKQQPGYTHLDVRPGGRYAIEIAIDGGYYRGTGEFREVAAPERLVFTWAWERIPPKPSEYLQATESLITIQLIDRGEQTEMLFTQERLENQASYRQHKLGWEGCFRVLSSEMEQRATVAL